MNVVIIGAGLIGAKRADAVVQNSDLKLVCDVDTKKAEKLASKYDAAFCVDYNDALSYNEIDIVIVATINKLLLPISVASLKAGKHILCEKPLGLNVKESQTISSAAEKYGKIVKTGFNHRFHPAIIKTKELLGQQAIGKILNIRSRYGHGGRPGMEKEWRCSKELCGGGELIDQGVHIIDLCRWFTSMEVDLVYGKTYTSFWKTDVEDNAFFNLEFNNGVLAQCHVSWTNWKNIFSFEIFGTEGYIKIEGLGGSYGVETLEFGNRNKEGGIPDIKYFKYPGGDNSWDLEWKEFKQAIEQNREPIGSGIDGLKANQVIGAIYESSALGRSVKIKD